MYWAAFVLGFLVLALGIFDAKELPGATVAGAIVVAGAVVASAIQPRKVKPEKSSTP